MLFRSKSPAEIFPEYILVRVNEFDKVAVTPLEEWVAYLKSGVIKENTTAPGLQEARKKLQYYSMTDAERYAYDEHLNAVMIQNDVLGNAREEGLAEGRAEGLTQGRAEGRAEAKKDIVKSMLSNGLSVEQAAKYSGLTVEEVESIK